ncbi:MAG: acetyl-CoA hydrolase/transferase C-terminal domain-containing protein [Planctomycetales bacterium]
MLDWKSKTLTPEEAVSHLKGNMTIFVHGAAATPTPLLEAMVHCSDLSGMRLVHMHLEGNLPFASPQHSSRFRSISLFTGAGLRDPIAEGRADFVPVFLSDIPRLFQDRVIPLDAAIVQVSPPDRHGLCSLGTSVDSARAAVDQAPLILAEVNEQMPRTHGNATVPWHRITACIHTDRPLPEHPQGSESDVEARIGELIAELVEDRACLQLGIGGIPGSVLKRLGNKRDLGIHTEMFSDGVIDLVEAGVITNRFKEVHPGRIVTSFVMGTRRLYDFVDDNPLVEFHPCDRTNDTGLIRKLDRMIAVNSALQIDLTGQVCADSIGHRIYSGIGGQMDFIRGAAVSRGGKPIIALPSTAAHGKVSRIVPELAAGSGVVTTRGHIHWVVTEYGRVNLHGRSLKERGELLTSICHPDFRQDLIEKLRGLKRFT